MVTQARRGTREVARGAKRASFLERFDDLWQNVPASKKLTLAWTAVGAALVLAGGIWTLRGTLAYYEAEFRREQGEIRVVADKALAGVVKLQDEREQTLTLGTLPPAQEMRFKHIEGQLARMEGQQLEILRRLPYPPDRSRASGKEIP